MSISSNLKSILSDIERVLDTYLINKAPLIPKDIKELIVKVLPYLVAIGFIMSVVGLLSVLRIFLFQGPYYDISNSYVFGVSYYLNIAFLAINSVILGLAFFPLKAQKRKGWEILFIGALLGFVVNLLFINIIGVVLVLVLGFYPLFQIKEYYK